MNKQNKWQGIRAAIIDLDGTMVDTALDFHVTVNHIRDAFLLAPIKLERLRQFVGKGSRHLTHSAMLEDWPQDKVDFHAEEISALFHQYYAQANGEYSQLYPDALAGLEKMQTRGLRLACVTNKKAVYATPLLKKMGLDKFFEIAYSGDAFSKMKPDPMPMTAVLTHFDLTSHEVVAVGDTTNDAKAARGAGCAILRVPYGYHQGESVHEFDSDGIVESLLEVAHLIC